MSTIVAVPIDSAVTALNCRGTVWAYVIRTPTGVAMFDTGYTGDEAELIAAIETTGALGSRTTVIASHGHADHVGGLAGLLERTNAVSYAHRLDAAVIRGEAPQSPPNLTDWERPIFDAVSKDLPDAAPARIDHEVDDGDVIDIGEPAHVVHTPGHTPGSIALHLPQRRMLLTGDSVAGVEGRPLAGYFCVDRSEALRSFRKLAELDVDVACFGHGAPILRSAGEVFRRQLKETAPD